MDWSLLKEAARLLSEEAGCQMGSNVIKSSDSAGSSVQKHTLDKVAPAGEQAGQSVQARQEEILAEARRKAESIEREAYQRGFSQGEKAGDALGRQKLEPIVRTFAQLADELSTLRRNLLDENGRFILQMGFLAAAEILHSEIINRDDAVLSNIRAALEKVVRAADMRLRVSPHDYKLIQAHLPELLSRIADSEEFHLEADAEVARGGCFLTTEAGDIDAQIDTQLAILRQALLSEE
jgi:flagellar assembly protein FliH